jgi:hypothetical protein
MIASTIPHFDEIEQHPDDAVTAYSYFPPTEAAMRGLAQDLFGSDGYLTIDLGPWHFHLCVGPHQGSTSEELRRMRPVAKVGFFERRAKGCAGGRSRGLRLWNGYGEQMTTVFLPNPRLSDDQQLLAEPDWSRLDVYYRLRSKYLAEPMPDDIQAIAEQALPSMGA